MAFDIIIRGAEAVLADRGVTACDIAVKSGKIAGIFEPATPQPSEQ